MNKANFNIKPMHFMLSFVINEKNKKFSKKFEKGIDISKKKSIIYMLPTGQPICESGGTGRRARLRGVWLHRTGSSPVSRTKQTRVRFSVPLFVLC